LGSEPEGQEFFRSVAKPQYRFQDGGSASLMTAAGWESDNHQCGILLWWKMDAKGSALGLIRDFLLPPQISIPDYYAAGHCHSRDYASCKIDAAAYEPARCNRATQTPNQQQANL
jgi:hypothetical protein